MRAFSEPSLCSSRLVAASKPKATGRRVSLKIVVIGGTGRVGSKLVAKLTEHGHEAVPASPKLGINTITGEGLAKALDGADISFFIGLLVAGLLYYAFTRSVDVAAETRIAEAEAAELERAAEQHRTS